jgi:hypothetical protein
MPLHHLKASQPSSEDILKRQTAQGKICLTKADSYSHNSPTHTIDNKKASADETKDTGRSMIFPPFGDMTLQKSENDASLDKPPTVEPIPQDDQLIRTMGSSPPYSPPNVRS